MPTVEQILDEAGQILSEPGGWMQGWYRNSGLEDSTSFCSLGAIREAYRRNGRKVSDENGATAVLRDTLIKSGVKVAGHVDKWNDAAVRTQPEVVAMFEKARAYAAEKGL